MIPPATAVNYIPWAIVAFIFQYLIRRRHFSWWAKYNCELSSLLRQRAPMSSPNQTLYSRCTLRSVRLQRRNRRVTNILPVRLFIPLYSFFQPPRILTDSFSLCRLQYPTSSGVGPAAIQNWWGNTVYQNTADADYAAMKQVGHGEKFG